MKASILFLILFGAMTAAGQASQATADNYLLRYESVPAIREPQRVVTCADLEAYAMECYNDSTLMHCMEYFAFEEEKERVIYFDTKPEHYATYECWVHREPTFTGFLEYMRRKE